MSVWSLGGEVQYNPQVQFDIQNGQGKFIHNSSTQLVEWKAQWMAIKQTQFISLVATDWNDKMN